MISTHAVENYRDRVLNIEDGQVGEDVDEFIRKQIRLAVRSPDIIYKDGEDESPIHIRNGCAIPVKNEGNRKYVPTVYNARTFTEKMNNYE